MNDEVQMIPIERIRILNPRQRDRKKFEVIVQSIKNLGLKKPIQVSLRSESEPEGPGYDLVCGQGRMEAFTALGHKEIPAIVVQISKEERPTHFLSSSFDSVNFANSVKNLLPNGSTPAKIGAKKFRKC